MKCRHLEIAEEAYLNGLRTPGYLCAWGSNRQLPPWADRLIGGGVLIEPRSECMGCPCFERQTETAERGR